MKIAVIGYSGAGKSTLAGTLGARYGCPVLHLDQVHFVRNWEERDRGEALELVERFMAGESWIIDGNYDGFLQQRRLREADQIIFLRFHRFACLHRVLRRYRQFRGRSRDSMAEGCTEKLDAAFLRWVLWESRSGEKRRHYEEILARYPEKTAVLRNQRELDHYLEGIPC